MSKHPPSTPSRRSQGQGSSRGRSAAHPARVHPPVAQPAAPARAMLAALTALEAQTGRISGDERIERAIEAGAKLNAEPFRLRGLIDRWFRHAQRLRYVAETSGLGTGLIARWAVFAALIEKRPPEAILPVMRGAANGEMADAAALRRAITTGFDHRAMPEAVGLELPEDFFPLFKRAFGPRLQQEALASLIAPPTTVRVNTLKGTREEAIESLARENIRAEPALLSPLGLVFKQRADIAKLDAFTSGLIEVQDEGSQIIAMLADVRPGMQVLDFCAGAGGKTLALAAAMENKGHLVAADTHAKRLQRARVRLKRAGAENAERVLLTGEENDPWLRKNAGKFERVLVDAPCTGTGSWRRNPDARASITLEELGRLTELQAKLLVRARRLVKPGGMLIYSTCSVLLEENDDITDAFLRNHPEARPVDLATIFESKSAAPWPGDGPTRLQLTPALHGTDGFYAAAFAF